MKLFHVTYPGINGHDIVPAEHADDAVHYYPRKVTYPFPYFKETMLSSGYAVVAYVSEYASKPFAYVYLAAHCPLCPSE